MAISCGAKKREKDGTVYMSRLVLDHVFKFNSYANISHDVKWRGGVIKSKWSHAVVKC